MRETDRRADKTAADREFRTEASRESRSATAAGREFRTEANRESRSATAASREFRTEAAADRESRSETAAGRESRSATAAGREHRLETAAGQELSFETPGFGRRLKSMLGVDFYRLFHTPMFYIFLAIAAIIPAMVLGTSGTTETAAAMYASTWNIIAADTPLYIVNNMGDYANMNMVFIFGGIMVSIFIGHDYKSGYVKQLFTTHAKKIDYMLSKSVTCAFAMACMCITYLLGGTLAGLLVGASMKVNFGSLLIAILGKMVMSLGWASLYTFLNVIFRRYFGISIASSFFFGTGILIIGVAGLVGNTSALNIFLYGASVFACLGSNLFTLAVCIVVSVAWAVLYNLLGTFILSRSDVY